MARMLTTPTMSTWTMIYLQEDPGMLFVCVQGGFGVFVLCRPALPFPFSCVRLAPLCVCCALSPSVALNFFRASPLAQSTRHSSDSEMMSITFAAFVSSSALHVPASALASMRLTGLPVHQMHHALPLMRVFTPEDGS